MLANNKYRKLLISLVGLLVFLIVALSIGYYLNGRINSNTQRLEVLHILDDETQAMLSDIQKLALITEGGDDLSYKTVSYEQTFHGISQRKESISRLLNVLRKGGVVDDKNAANGRLAVDAADSEVALSITQKLQAIWPAYLERVNQLTLHHNLRLNNSVAEFAQGEQPKIKTLLHELYHHNIQENSRLARYNQAIQLITVAVLVAYFLFFVYFLMRRLQQADVQVDGALQEIHNIMATVDAGLFLLNPDLTIGESYSNELENLLGQKNLGGKNMMDVVGHLLSDADLQATQGFIKQLYNPKTKEKLIATLNPLSSIPVSVEGKRQEMQTRYLGFRFKRVYEDKTISRILVSVSDVTSSVLLAQKAEEQRADSDLQLEMLGLIVNSERSEVLSFVQRAKQHAWDINTVLKRTDDGSPTELREKLNSIFRSVHSLKGEAGALSFRGFTALVQNIETELVQKRNNPNLSGEDFMGLVISLEDLIRLVQLLEDVIKLISQPQADASGQTQPDQYYRDMVNALAERNHKQIDFFCSGLEQVDNSRLGNLIRDLSVQLLRNAVVHGIETAAERQAQRKLPAGRVRMEITVQDDMLHLGVEDDGRGLDYEAIRAHAVAAGLYDEQLAASLDPKQLTALIFHPGFSTAKAVSEDAGHGVGLDIIRERVVGQGGKIRVSSVPGAFTRFNFSLPIRK